MHYPADLAANVHFKSLNGEIYTDFPKAEDAARAGKPETGRPTAAAPNTNSPKTRPCGWEKAGPTSRFETLNGDVTIKQQTIMSLLSMNILFGAPSATSSCQAWQPALRWLPRCRPRHRMLPEKEQLAVALSAPGKPGMLEVKPSELVPST